MAPLHVDTLTVKRVNMRLYLASRVQRYIESSLNNSNSNYKAVSNPLPYNIAK